MPAVSPGKWSCYQPLFKNAGAGEGPFEPMDARDQAKRIRLLRSTSFTLNLHICRCICAMLRPMPENHLKLTTAMNAWQRMKSPVLGMLVLAMTCGARAESLTILMPDGSPATKARVELRELTNTRNEEPEKLVMNTLDVNSRGEVDLKDLESKHSYRDRLLVIDAPGAALALHNSFKSPETVKLVPAFDVNGRMVTNEGQAVADGNVSVADFGIHSYVAIYQPVLLEGIPGFHAKTDEKGSFKLRGATFDGFDRDAGAHLLGEAKVAQKGFVGYVTASYRGDSSLLKKPGGDPSTAHEDPIELVVYPLGRVSGTIVDGHTGKPREAAVVRLVAPRLGLHGKNSVTVGKDGSFSFEDVPSYQQRSFEVTWETPHHVHPPKFSSPENLPQIADVTGLMIPTYSDELRKGRVVDEVSGKPPVITLDLGYEQESDIGQGWTGKSSGCWGNIGMDARTGQDGSFEMWLPTGPFTLTVEASDRFRTKPYDLKLEMNPKPGESTPLTIKVPRKMGILVMNQVPENYPFGHDFWNELSIEVETKAPSRLTTISNTDMWFHPVANWGEKIEVSVYHQELSGGNRKTLLPKTIVTVTEDMWPYVLKIPTR